MFLDPKWKCIAFADQIEWEAFAFFLSALLLILLAWGAYGFVFGCCERSISDYDQIDYNENEIDSPENQVLMKRVLLSISFGVENLHFSLNNFQKKIEGLRLKSQFIHLDRCLMTVFSPFFCQTMKKHSQKVTWKSPNWFGSSLLPWLWPLPSPSLFFLRWCQCTTQLARIFQTKYLPPSFFLL